MLTYNQIQSLLFTNHCDLSTYRFLLEQVSHVAVLGQAPPRDLEPELQTLLGRGDQVVVPTEVRGLLEQRRALARKVGPWVEGHYRPGRPLKGDGTL